MVKINLVADKFRPPRTATVSRWTRALLSFCMIGLPLGAGLAMGYALGHHQSNPLEDEIGIALRERLRIADPAKIDAGQLRAIANRMVELEARVVRLDALGERVVDMAKLDAQDAHKVSVAAAAVGGPDNVQSAPPAPRDIYGVIDRLASHIDSREQQLDSLEELLANRKIGDRALYGAAPVYRGEISSYFGMRIDPFTGRSAAHEGIDFSGKPGTAIMAAGDGVVTFAGEKEGYGRLIEINHGDDCYSRYAHSKLTLVKPGDLVKKGQVIALMGSSGRSTGSHLHFEVYKHGRAVDPFVYIRQASR